VLVLVPDKRTLRGVVALPGPFRLTAFPKRKPRRRWGWWRGFNGRLAKEG
jgi:hypothetical protein